ncbi:MAG: HAD family hydrolase [Clostridia bacterium]
MQKSYALFDFDGTLLKGDSIVRFCLYAHQKGLCGKGDLLYGAWMAVLYLCRLTTAERAKQASLRFLAGKEEQQLSTLAESFCREVLVPALYPQGVQALQCERLQGAEVLLLTASPSFYLEPLKQRLGIAEIIGTRMDVQNGVFSGLICGDNCRGVQKPLRLAEYLAAKGDRLVYDESSAYGDSGSDLPMLQLCRRKIAVNPKRKLLGRLQHEQNVTVVHWANPASE